MAKTFRQGKDLIEADAKKNKGGRKFTNNIYWKDGDVSEIAFLTGAEEFTKVRLHQMVKIPDDTRDSGFRYDTLLCKKDPSMADEFDGTCDLCDRVGHKAEDKIVALAVGLETEREGRNIKKVSVARRTWKKDDGTEGGEPAWGLVVQAHKNFYAFFIAYDTNTGDIREVPWSIHREGGGTDTKYHANPLMNGRTIADMPDMSAIADELPELLDLLEEMGSEERYAQVADVQPGSQRSFGGGQRPMNDAGTVPAGDRESQFEKIKGEVVSTY